MNIVTPPAEELMKLSQTLADLLDEATALLWIATHDRASFDPAAACQSYLDIKARGQAAVAAAFGDG